MDKTRYKPQELFLYNITADFRQITAGNGNKIMVHTVRVIFKDFIGCSSSGLSRAEPPQSVRESYTPPHNPDVDISCRA